MLDEYGDSKDLTDIHSLVSQIFFVPQRRSLSVCGYGYAEGSITESDRRCGTEGVH